MPLQTPRPSPPASPSPALRISRVAFTLFLGLILFATDRAQARAESLFPERADVGRPSRPGALETVEADGITSYLVTGGGENMWSTNDAFHFVWVPMRGDLSLQAAIEWVGGGGDPHRKACLMVRENSHPDSAYVDVAVHGDGLISLQFRETRGGPTREIQANVGRPATVGLARQGDVFWMTVPDDAGLARPAGPFHRVRLSDPILVGLAVCAHDDRRLERARFTDVRLVQEARPVGGRSNLHATLETIAIASGDRRAVYTTTNLIEAPNWSPDGKHFYYNERGRIRRLPVSGSTPEPIDTGFAVRCNNDHGLSPDGKTLVISDQTRGGQSLIYLVPVTGGEPRLVTPLGPSYWHGWSPDGRTLAYCAERQGDYDVYTIPVEGGSEVRLTDAPGLDDGPDYSPDGKWIYFNSERTGLMQVWRMRPDGTSQEQITFDAANNWFPHPSPDGKWIAFLSYEKDVKGHPANQPVRLRLVAPNGGPIRELARLFGGQGTLNVPSWSPDSRQFAFVSYEFVVR